MVYRVFEEHKESSAFADHMIQHYVKILLLQRGMGLLKELAEALKLIKKSPQLFQEVKP